jgi:hypothetical protein
MFSRTLQGWLQYQITDKADWDLFDQIAEALVRKYAGRIVQRLDGLDERYWDIEINKTIIVLHLQHYLGIYLFALDRIGDDLVQVIGADFISNSASREVINRS